MKISKSELVPINVPTGTTAQKFYFPDNSVLRTTANQLVKTKGIEFYPSEAVSTSPDGQPVMSSADLATGYLVLYVDNGEYLKFPISKLVSVINNTNAAWPGETANYPHVINLVEFADANVNWPKSYVLFPSALNATGVQILSTVYYDFYTR